MTLCFWGVCLSPAVAALTTERQRRLFAFESRVFRGNCNVAGLGGLLSSHSPGWISNAYTHVMINRNAGT